MRLQVPMTPARWALLAVLVTGLVTAVYRFWVGLGAATNLNDSWPWGLWIGMVLTLVASSGGAFVMAAVIYIFHSRTFRPIARMAVLTGFLGYLSVIMTLIIELGLPYRIWHPVVYWQHHSAMFEIAWCVMCYTTVLFLEFVPVLLEKLHNHRLARAIHAAIVPIAIAGVVFSTLHQSSLGSLFLLTPGKLHPLWYTPLLPVLFFVSAIGLGLSVLTLVGLAARATLGPRVRETLRLETLREMARAIPWVLAVYLLLKVVDLAHRDGLGLLVAGGREAFWFWVEMVAGVIAPMVLLAFRRVRESQAGLAAGAATAVAGIILNRLNISLTGMVATATSPYWPRWTEIAIVAGIVAGATLVWILVVENFPIFVQEEEAEVVAAMGGRLSLQRQALHTGSGSPDGR